MRHRDFVMLLLQDPCLVGFSATVFIGHLIQGSLSVSGGCHVGM